MKFNIRFIITLLAMIMIPMIFMALISQQNAVRVIYDNIYAKVDSVAKLKERLLVAEVESSFSKLRGVLSRTQLRQKVSSHNADPNDADKAVITKILSDAFDVRTGLKEMFVLGSDGELLSFVNISKKPSTDQFYSAVFGKAKPGLFLDLIEGPNNEFMVLAAGPMFVEDRFIGVAGYLSTDAQFANITKDTMGLGNTEEIVLAKNIPGGKVRYLFHSRTGSDAGNIMEFAGGRNASPVTQALLGREAVFRNMIDFRGNKVLAATRYIEQLKWGLVVKVDEDEAFYAIKKLNQSTLLYGLIITLVSIFFAYVISKTISDPIEQLTEATKRIHEGDYEFKADSVSINIEDEIGGLYRAFKIMADNLKRSTVSTQELAEEVKNRREAESTSRRLYEEMQESRTALLNMMEDVESARQKLEYANEELRISEENFRTLVSNVPGTIYRSLCDKYRTMKYMSGAIVDISGHAHHNFIDNNKLAYTDIIHPDDVKRVTETIDEAIKKQAPYFMEYRLMHKNGSVRWAFERGQASFDADGNVEYLDGAIFDITDRKDIEERFREQSVALNSSAYAVYITDPEGVIQWINPAFTKMTGFNADEAYGKTPRILKSGLVKDEVYVDLWTTIKSGKNWSGELLNRKKDGALFYADVIISPVLDEDNEIKSLVSIAQDISERKRFEESLKESEEKFKNAVEYSAIGIALVTIDGRWLQVNRSLCGILGYKEEELTQLDHSMVTHHEDTQKDAHLVNELLQGERDYYYTEKRYIHRDGSIIWVLLSVSLVKDVAGNPLYFVTQIQDITERIEAENKLREAMETKTKFTSVVSHELRTPLTAIKEGINIVIDGSAGDINEEQHEFLNLAKRNVDRLSRLINDVLDFQKLQAGKMDFVFKPNDMNRVVEEVYRTMKLAAQDKMVKLAFNPREGLPEVSFDNDRITQVVVNLVNNAIKFSEKGNVEISTRADDNNVIVSVKDDGMGIKSEDLERLFKSFEQIGGSERKVGGTGLGLAISQEIVRRHNGKIWVESEFGKGSTFSFSIPLNESGQKGRG